MTKERAAPKGAALFFELKTQDPELQLSEAPVGIEPTVGDLQSPALPLGDGAVPEHHRQQGNVSTSPRQW